MKKFVDGVVRKNDPELEMTPDLDLQKRRFLKALGFLGLGAFFISLFPKKAQAIFFGSTMRSDTVGLKNIAGTAINPATEAKQDDIIGALTDTYDVLIAVDSGDANVTYIGKAAKGALTSASVWQIKIIDSTSGVSISFKGDVDTFTQEWDEREA